MSGKLSKAELKRLEELKLKLDLQQKKLNNQKQKNAKEKKSLDADRKKISQEWKALDRAKKKFADSKEAASKQSLSANMKAQGRKSQTNKKYQNQFFQMKKKHDAESKKARDYKKKLDQLQIENKVLRMKLKNLRGRKRGKGDDKRLRQLIRENRELRKRLRKIMKELNKRRRWYKRSIKIFKHNQDKWVNKQRAAWKNKKFIIKYVFLDDVKYIKQYQKPRKGRDKIQFKNRIRVKTKGGGETTIKNVEIIVLDGDDNDTGNGGDDEDDDEEYEVDKDGKKTKKKKKKKGKKGGDDGDDEEYEVDKDGKKTKKKKKKKGKKGGDDEESKEDDGGKGKGKKKKKKGAKSAAEQEAEMEAFLAEFAGELGLMNDEVLEDEEEIKSDEENELDEDFDGEDEESDGVGAGDDDKDDLDEDMDSDDGGGDSGALEAQLLYVRQEMDERGNDLERLKEIMSGPDGDIDGLLGEIEERQTQMIKNLEDVDGDGDNAEVEGSNKEWRKYVLNLAKSMVGNTEGLNLLLGVVSDGFLKELQGRLGDLGDVNDVYYAEEVKEEIDFAKLKGRVDGRHGEILSDVGKAREEIDRIKQEKENKEEESNEDVGAVVEGDNYTKMRELYEGLLGANTEWNELINRSGVMYTESQSAKNGLIQALLAKYSKLEGFIGKVDKIPSTVLF